MSVTKRINPLVVETPEDMEKRRSDFVDWWEDAPTTQYINEEGAILELQAPRRGNQAYVKKQRKRYRRLLDRLGDERRSPLRYQNRKTIADTSDFFFTFTYDHKRYTIDEANARVSDDLKKMRTYINRIFDSQFGTITCYESTEAGYPAPHMMIRFDKSYPVFSHLSKKTQERSWRLKKKDLLLRFQLAWSTLGGGWCDVKGIVSDTYNGIVSKIQYTFKYLTKTVMGDKYSVSNPLIALNTLSNNKAFNRGTVYISPRYIARLENPPLSRLDIIRTKLQQARNRLTTIKRKILKKPELEPTFSAIMNRLRYVISVLLSHLPPPEWRYYATIDAWVMRLRKNKPANANI